MSITLGKTGYNFNGMGVAPTSDFGYGTNPYDPTDPSQVALYVQWEGQHQGDAQQIGDDYSPGRNAAIIGGVVGGGALASAAMGPASVGLLGGAGGGAGAGAGGGGAAMLGGGGEFGADLVGGGNIAAATAGGGAGMGGLWPQLIAGAASGIEGAYESGQNRDQNQGQFDANLREQQAALAQALAISQAELAQNQSQFDASQKQNQGQFDSTQGRLYGQQALAATQMDPFKQAKSREGQALLASLLGTGYQPGGLKNVMTPEGLAGAGAFATPDAMAGNEAAFTANAQKASGGQYVPPNANQVGYGGGGGGGGLAALLAALQSKPVGQ